MAESLRAVEGGQWGVLKVRQNLVCMAAGGRARWLVCIAMLRVLAQVACHASDRRALRCAGRHAGICR